MKREFPYNKLKMTLGVLGMFLPFLLMLANIIGEEDSVILPSISSYYHITSSAGVFVGILFSFGIILMFDNQYVKENKWDDRLTSLAGVSAMAVAIFRCGDDFVGKFHLFAAVLFFVCLAFLCFWFFTKTNKPKNQIPISKILRNWIYRISAIIILLSLIFIWVYWKYYEGKWSENTVFWLETVALEAFGISWLIKGWNLDESES